MKWKNFLILALSSMPCQAASGESVLRVGVSKIRNVFDPAFAPAAGTVSIVRNIHRSLIRQDEYARLVSELAYVWTISSDRKTYSFCVKDQKFHDGRTMDREDVRYSVRRLLSAPLDSYYRPIIAQLDPEVLENKTLLQHPGYRGGFCFDIKLAFSSPDFMNLLATPIMSIVPKGSKPEDKVGAGPYFVYDNDQANHRIVLKKAANQGIASDFDTMQFVEYPYSKEIVSKLASGEIDLYLGIDDYQNLPEPSKAYSIAYMESLSITHAFLNVNRPLFQDEAFRQDVCPLLQDIVRAHPSQHAEALIFQPHFMPKGLLPWSYYKKIRYEPMDATAFIKKWKGHVQPGTIRIVATINQLNKAMVEALAAAFAGVGLRLEYISDFYGRSNDLIEKDDYDIRFSGWHGIHEKPESFVYMLDSNPFKKAAAASPIRTLLDRLPAIRSMNDGDAQKTLADELIDLERRCLFVPLFRIKTPILHSNRLKIPSSQFRDFLEFPRIQLNRDKPIRGETHEPKLKNRFPLDVNPGGRLSNS